MNSIIKNLLRTLLALFLLLNIVTAFHAYKFTHFYDAAEAPPKMQVSGWGKTKNILFGINAFKQRNNVSPDTTFQTVFLKSSTCPKLEAWYIPADSAVGTVCMFHG